MDDEVAGPWTLQPELQASLRLQQVRKTLSRAEWDSAAVEAEELLDEYPDHPEALLLLGQAELERGDAETALLALARHLEVVDKASAVALCSLAAARFHLCDLPGALELAREAVRLDAALAAAHWFMGMALERLPDRTAEAASHFAAAHQLDAESFPFPLVLTESEWQDAVSAALGDIHPQLRSFWDGVPVLLAEVPDLRRLRESDPPITPAVTGLYVGEPPEDDEERDQSRPEALRLYIRNLARVADVEQLVDRIADLLEHEALDWLGLTFEDLDPVEDA